MVRKFQGVNLDTAPSTGNLPPSVPKPCTILSREAKAPELGER